MNQNGKPLKMMRVDLHCHTEISWDCSTPVALFPDRCRERKIAVQAITDHDEIAGAQRLKALVEEQKDPLTVIIGEEITTNEGEIIGLFLKEKIERGLTPEETVTQIKAQGGLVLLPHGFDKLKRGRLKSAAIERIGGAIDIVETFNTRISHPKYNQEAALWAQERGLLMSGGSDAHTLADVGSAWVEVPAQPIHGPDDLLRALAGNTPAGDWTHPVIAYAYKTWDRLRRRFNTSNY